MKQNNITTAPECSDINSLYRFWRETHVGSLDDFYNFMTWPSVERDLFLISCNEDFDMKNGVTHVNYSK